MSEQKTDTKLVHWADQTAEKIIRTRGDWTATPVLPVLPLRVRFTSETSGKSFPWIWWYVP